MKLTPPSQPPQLGSLDSCDREQIQFAGHVQSYGCLIAVDPSWMVTHASENCGQIFGVEFNALLGQSLTDFLCPQAIHDLRGRLQHLTLPDSVGRLFGIKLRADSERLFDVGLFESGEQIVIDLEHHALTDFAGAADIVRPMIARTRGARSVTEMCRTAALQVRLFTGFDRVMIYRFHPDHSGEVIAEAARPGMETYLGLRYPASDIPKQARDLYRRNMLRLIADVDDKVVPIRTKEREADQPLDLSLSGLRAVSPIHLEYLRNMGVHASMSISIMRRGELWGLIACHHETPRPLTYEQRSTAELYGEIFAFVLEQLENDLAQNELNRAQMIHDLIMSEVAAGRGLKENFETISNAIGSVIPCDGVAAVVEDEVHLTGTTPPLEHVRGIRDELGESRNARVFSTDHLKTTYPPADEFSDVAAGVLAIPVSSLSRDFVFLFRKEAQRTITWAGNPEKAITRRDEGRISPRKSFEAWKTSLRQHSLPWNDREVRVAEMMRTTLVEVVFRLNDRAREEKARATEHQELLIAELNHRVRNILNLIRGLVSQSQGGSTTAAELTSVLGGRIQALARAHDQIMAQDGTAASLREMIATECEAYFSNKADRVNVTGPDCYLTPEAFSTLSLVIHELVTNSAKYGALSDQHGRVDISLAEEADVGLRLDWAEADGPPVKAPTRRGFGSTIIERSIPHNLGGEAHIQYPETGAVAQLMVPVAHVERFTELTAAIEKPLTENDQAAVPPLGDVLIVEDNMIIALDGQNIFTDLGAASVEVTPDVATALAEIDRGDISFAFLDVNLGHETSLPIAEALAEKKIPFIFATGYGETSEATAAFPRVPVVQKPYDKAAVVTAVNKVLGQKNA